MRNSLRSEADASLAILEMRKMLLLNHVMWIQLKLIPDMISRASNFFPDGLLVGGRRLILRGRLLVLRWVHLRTAFSGPSAPSGPRITFGNDLVVVGL